MFTRVITGVDVVWAGTPSDQAAHDWLLQWIRDLGVPFNNGVLTNTVKGNLGESVCYAIGFHLEFPGLAAIAPNALMPLREISRADVDIIWLSPGDSTGAGVLVIVQEVKTTSATNLALADDLVTDYKKLFDTDPQFTLHTRLQAAASELHYARGKPKVVADRVRSLAGLNPQTTNNVSLLPSLVYDSATTANPGTKMSAVRQAIIALGWASAAVASWAVGLGDLDDRLARLKAGSP